MSVGDAPFRRAGVPRWFGGPVRLYDAIQRVWDAPGAERVVGVLLVAAYLGSLAAIEAGRRGLLPAGVAAVVPRSHFAAVGAAFTLLLVVETLSLVFSLARSVADAVGKQFELLSVILLRKSFVAFGGLTEPVHWPQAGEALPVVLADVTGALLVFVVTGAYYRVQRHRPITDDDAEGASFVAAKKVVALALLAAFAVLVLRAAAEGLANPAGSGHELFERFYTVLIFSDVLVVLVALCYGGGYPVVFRNSGFAAATLVLRLAVTAPPYLNAALGVGAALFGVAVSLAYNAYAPAGGRVAPPPAALGGGG